MRIDIPENPDEFIKLALALSAQNTKLGDDSPLKNIKGIDQLATLSAAADTQNKLAAQLYEQAATATEARDRAIGNSVKTPGTLQFLVTASRNVLLGNNKGAEHVLGDWGFNVVESPAVTPQQKAARTVAKAAKIAAKGKTN